MIRCTGMSEELFILPPMTPAHIPGLSPNNKGYKENDVVNIVHMLSPDVVK